MLPGGIFGYVWNRVIYECRAPKESTWKLYIFVVVALEMVKIIDEHVCLGNLFIWLFGAAGRKGPQELKVVSFLWSFSLTNEIVFFF